MPTYDAPPFIAAACAAGFLLPALAADAVPPARAAAPALTAPAAAALPARSRGAAAPPRAEVLPVADVSLALGEIRMLPVQGKVRRIAVGNGAQVSATTVDDSLMLIGEQVGTTMLMVWSDRQVQTFRVKVVASDFAATRRLVENVLRDERNVSIEEYDAKLVVSGTVHQETLAQLSEAVKSVPGVVLNLKTDPGSPLVRSVLFRLHFVEVNKALLEKIGIQWSKEANGPTVAAQGVALQEKLYRGLPQAQPGDNLLTASPPFVTRNGHTTGLFFGLATSIASRLNLGRTDGDARVLASPELTAKSGGKARLQVGGEIPIPMAGAFGAQTVEFKPYGIIFSIEPTIDNGDVITAKLSTELSQIDPAITVSGIPAFLTRSTSTEISVKPGEMVALSGLINGELSNAIDKVPGLGNIPILGRLFRSDDFRSKKSDLVVLLEPEIITAGQGMAEEVRRRGADNKAEFERRVGEGNH
ncbi:MAG: pilus assembly protein N-terminal domain-containing protein [Roseateles sp.]|uniref:type II and III secretion system protein family protein n=1 Tax=Roseateles sp. TaxID=1971397 RepID=UPI0039ECFB9A